MNEDTKKLEEQLEKATAEGDRMDGSLDAETVALREGWLALGRLIETAQPARDASPALQYPAETVPARCRKPVGLKTLAGLATLAAALLVAAIATLSFVEDRPDAVTARPEIAQDERGGKQSTLPVLAQDAPKQKNGTDADDVLAWDSSLDTEIATAGQEMLRIQADWYASDDTASSIYYRMEQMRQELNNNTL